MIVSSTKEFKREHHKFNAADETLGRLAVKIANLLRGKDKVGFTYHQDCGDFVTVVNPKLINVTGNKMADKKYYRHSLYPGGLRETSLEKMIATKPEEVIVLAVKNMLPKNRLQAKWLKRLTFKKEL